MAVMPFLADLQATLPLIEPSLLSCDFGHLAREVHRLEDAGAKMLHLDVMDGNFVPNLTYGIPVVKAIRRATNLPLDAHLMISQPDRYIERFRDAGADMITVHIEAAPDPAPLLERIRGAGAVAGVVLNPPTPVESLAGCLEQCDAVLVMSVMPGFGGQKFQPVALEKLRWLRERVRPGVALAIDGGVNSHTIAACVRAGADLLVVGTALLDHSDYRVKFEELSMLAKTAKDQRT